MTSIQDPTLLAVELPGGGCCYGGSQEWYRTYWQRLSGCGPTNGSNLVWYLSRSRPELAGLWRPGDGGKEDFLALMEEMFQYIMPTMRGVNSTTIFRDGALRFADTRGLRLHPRVLDIPPKLLSRPSEAAVRDFLASALADDLPVAFLNLSNGQLKGSLDNWHWVTLIELDEASMTALMCDQGQRSRIDLGLWLRTTTLGGGFVALEQDRSHK